jgi:virginiamycin B lyase
MTPQTGGIVLHTPQSVSPALIKAAPMAKTAILPASVMNVRPQSAIQGLNWTQIPGAASSAAAAPDGSLWVLSNAPAGADKYIWHYASGNWTNISGLASRLAVAPNGTLYAINSGGGTYSLSVGGWTALGGGASAVTTAADGSFYVLSNGGAGPDRAIWHHVGGTWSQVPGSGVSIAGSFDTGSYTLPSGTVSPGGLYILNSIGSIYYENTNTSFVQLPGSASAVTPTTIGGIFALGYPTNSSGNSIYYYDLNTPGWSAQSGAGVSISSAGGQLYVIGSSGGIYSSPVRPAFAEYTIPTGNSSGPYGITTGPDGALWFTESLDGKIGRVTTSGTFTEYTIPTASSGPYGITTGPDGALWFTEDNAGKIGRVTTSGTFTEYTLLPTAECCPSGITTGPDGALWFTEGSTNKIGRATTSGTITGYTLPTANAHPDGIITGPDGALWFTELDGNNIGRVTTSGTITEYPVPTASSQPAGITTGPDRALWFTEYQSGNIGRFSP